MFYQSSWDSCFNAWTVVNYTFALASAPLILWYWIPDLNITIDKMYKLLCWCSPQFNSTCIYHKALFDVDTKAKFSYTWTQQIKKYFFLHIQKQKCPVTLDTMSDREVWLQVPLILFSLSLHPRVFCTLFLTELILPYLICYNFHTLE